MTIIISESQKEREGRVPSPPLSLILAISQGDEICQPVMAAWLLLLLSQVVTAVPPEPTPHLPVFRPPPSLEETDLPEFLSMSGLVRVVEGGTAFLQCSLTGLASHHLVSWLRLPDMSVLTVGGLVFSSDPRLAVTVSPGASIWQLEVRNVSLSDGGEYQCQVNTNTRLSTTVLLSVIGQ